MNRHSLHVAGRSLRQKLRSAPVAENVIVSLTSFPNRFGNLHLCIKSLLTQNLMPEKVILFLAKSEVESAQIPRSLRALEGERFEIVICEENFRPYNKLVHALVAEPDKTIITVDDDLVYPPYLVQRLVEAGARHPGCAVSLGAKLMVAKNYEEFVPYDCWSDARNIVGMQVFGRGVDGVLYPPRCLHSDVSHGELFMALAPTTDDLWFKVMLMMAGTKVVSIARKKREKRKSLRYRRHNALKDINGLGANDKNLAAIMQHYDLAARDFLFAEELNIQTLVPPPPKQLRL
ncbi:glycosyltransferase family 2 protein [Rhodomicrobium sp. Az07]|uniref:glycosyltransferase family A protein n=1 Tax=Rhodomicrobium sp. Az07 TaxID=2839034 RepID=UPI001BECD828|nr:glycosyltransferase family A protein [Rhodomicrobium sp. Az07]MBT3069795.1 glycosyltransferase family 2 protein [Rhodomicrobium sp. Az07]